MENEPKKMKSELQEVLEAEFTCYSYSGRSMYGKRCLAVDVEAGGLGTLIACVAQAAFEDGELGDPQSAEELIEQVGKVYSDQMGLGTVYYFPDVEFVEEGS